MHFRRLILSLAPVMMASSGCVLSVSPLPASYGPPVWQQAQQPVYSTPAAPSYPSAPEPTRDLGPLPPAIEESPPAPLEVPDLRPSGRKASSRRRVCALPE